MNYCWFCLLFFFFFFFLFKLLFGRHVKSYRGPKRYLDFIIFTLTVLISTNMSFFYFKFDDWLYFHVDELLILFTFFLSSNWSLASHGNSDRGQRRYLDFMIFTLTVTVFISIAMSFFDFKFDDWLLFHFDELLILFTLFFFFLVFKLMFEKPWKKLSRPKKVLRFSDFPSNGVHINSHVLLWLQIR
jgi:hypothetical protein